MTRPGERRAKRVSTVRGSTPKRTRSITRWNGCRSTSSNLQGSQKADQRTLVFSGQIQAERMTFHSARFDVRAFPATRDVVIPQPFCVKPVFKRGDRAGVF